MASALYKDILSDVSHSKDERAFINAVCGPTPWMVELSPDECRGHGLDTIATWCTDNFGQAAMPLMRMDGEWHIGTLGDMAWIGFRHEMQMQAFIACRLKLATIAREAEIQPANFNSAV